MKKTKEFESLNVLDDFLFNELAMQADKEKAKLFFRILLGTILHREIGELEIIPQKMLQGSDNSRHGIRMDAYVEAYLPESRETDIILPLLPEVFDIEPNQHAADSEERRTRFYHALIDAKILDAGIKYRDMKNVTLIMISGYDPFGRGRMVYTIGKHFLEEPEIPYHDGITTIFLNAYGTVDIPDKGLADLLRYLVDSRKENVVNAETQMLQDMVQEIKQNANKGVNFMHSWEIEQIRFEEGRQEGKQEGRLEGKQEGRLEGIISSIFDLLNDFGTVPDSLKQRIEDQKDTEVLRKWLKYAAGAKDMEDFEAKIR